MLAQAERKLRESFDAFDAERKTLEEEKKRLEAIKLAREKAEAEERVKVFLIIDFLFIVGECRSSNSRSAKNRSESPVSAPNMNSFAFTRRSQAERELAAQRMAVEEAKKMLEEQRIAKEKERSRRAPESRAGRTREEAAARERRAGTCRS